MTIKWVWPHSYLSCSFVLHAMGRLLRNNVVFIWCHNLKECNRLLLLWNVSSFFWELHGTFPILIVVCLNSLQEARPLHNESLILVCFGVLELTQTLLWVRSNYIFKWNFNLQLHWYFLGFKLSFCCYLQSLFSSQGYSLRDLNLACIWDNVFTVNINN
jgi:hypothetical protein